MSQELLVWQEKPASKFLIAGWTRNWSDGGEVSSGLPKYLIEKLGAKKIGEFSQWVAQMCYPFQAPGTHDTYRPRVAYKDGLPDQQMHRENNFYDAGNGLIIFLGEEPWLRVDIFGDAFFQAVKELGVSQTVTVEGYNGACPPDLERSVGCIYSQARMREDLDKYGFRYSSYGSQGRSGPTIGMAMVTLAHYQHPELDVFRVGAMAPMYPFMNSSNDPVGISTDHRSFYDIMRRLKAMFKLDLDLSELLNMAEAESRELERTLETLGDSNPNAKALIARAREDYEYEPFEEKVDLGAALDQALDDILRNAPESPESREGE